MSARNVIISLIAVVGILVFIFIKVRLEPKKKQAFNRNPSRIEYTAFALCRMECYDITANMVFQVIRKGETSKREKKDFCPVYMSGLMTKQNKHIIILIEQCGTMARVIDCYDANAGAPCNCTDKENRPLSFLNSKR